MSSDASHGTLRAAVISGVESTLVTVEVHRGKGLPGATIVGLAGKAVRESLERIRGACVRSDVALAPRQTTINLAPADHPKAGSGLDLPIALGLLIAEKIVPAEAFADVVCLGELQLDGAVRPVPGVLPAAVATARAGIGRLMVPRANGVEAAAVSGVEVIPVRSLGDAIRWAKHGLSTPPPVEPENVDVDPVVDLRDIAGQVIARRALEIAAAGGHHLMMVGVPGSGKTLLARALSGILPPLSHEESLETSAVYSVVGKLDGRGLLRSRPFRAPHHSVTAVGLIGGRVPPRPGEASLAHGGVLFLDELPEFRREALECLRQPLEEGAVTLVRGGRSVRLPARFQLVAAMNACPCGRGLESGDCRCTLAQVRGYWRRLSGPLLDRLDLVIHVEAVDLDELVGRAVTAEPSARVRERVVAARRAQARRWRRHSGGRETTSTTNAALPAKLLAKACPLKRPQRRFARRVANELGISARGWHRVLRAARTIADLSGRDAIGDSDLAEAFQYRRQGHEIAAAAAQFTAD